MNHSQKTTVQQLLDNVPDELLNQPRWFGVEENKVPRQKDWGNPKNQRLPAQIQGYKGFDVSGHGEGEDYLFFDFDHVFDEKGKFVNKKAEKLYNYCATVASYCEKSISGTGLHIIMKVPKGQFDSISAGSRGTLPLGGEAKLEIFYKTKARYCLFTGDVFGCQPKTPIASGEDILRYVLAEIEKQNPVKKSARNENIPLDFCKIQEMLDAIDPAALPYSDWLAVISSCKNCNVPSSVVDDWCKRDMKRYDAVENKKHWDSLCDPSFDMKTLYGIAKRFGYEPQEDFTDFRADSLFTGDFSDDDYASRLITAYGKKFRYLAPPVDEWLLYKENAQGGGVWTHVGEKNSALYPLVSDLSDNLIQCAVGKSQKKFGMKLKETKKKNSVISALKGKRDAIITLEDLDTHPELLNCRNGVIDLTTGKFYDKDFAKYLITKQCNAIYKPDIKDNTFMNFLKSIIPDEATRNALLRYLGYIATGEVSEEKAMFFYGSGANGKGTLTKTLMNLFGSYSTTLKNNAILLNGRTQDAGAATTELNPLQGARLAIIEEIPQGGKLDCARFKSLTGNDKIPIRKLHQEQTIIEPTAKLIISGNYLPELSDPRDPGLLRRLININFIQSFTGANCNPRLKRELAEPDALSGLLSIIVKEAILWYKEGLLISKKMEEARDTYLQEYDFISTFIAENCVLEKNLSIPRPEFIARIRNDYTEECLRQFSGSERNLVNAIKRVEGITYKRLNNGRVFEGIGWKERTPQSSAEYLTGDPLTADVANPFDE